jgi:hypothetical protein
MAVDVTFGELERTAGAERLGLDRPRERDARGRVTELRLQLRRAVTGEDDRTRDAVAGQRRELTHEERLPAERRQRLRRVPETGPQPSAESAREHERLHGRSRLKRRRTG